MFAGTIYPPVFSLSIGSSSPRVLDACEAFGWKAARAIGRYAAELVAGTKVTTGCEEEDGKGGAAGWNDSGIAEVPEFCWPDQLESSQGSG